MTDQVLERLARIEANLAEHMRRSDTLEAMHADLSARVIPLEAHVAGWAGAGKALAVLGTLAAVGGGLWRLLG